jgi:crotonobetainyl-CoA:carnitine CoA-transferase CaiB-like acyl-CoA transferase
MPVLSGYHVLDCANESAALCIKTLAVMGAEVVHALPESELARFRELLPAADFLIETAPPGLMTSLGFGYPALQKINPRLIMASITPFGQTGPHKDLKSSDLTIQALGGWLSVTGEPQRPLKLYGNQAYNTASLFTVNAVLLALLQRHETGKGQFIDVSILECVASTLDHVLVRYFYEGVVSGRRGGRHWNNAFNIFPCADGHCANDHILLSIHRQWETLVELMASEGMAADLIGLEWNDRDFRNTHIDHIIEVIGRWTLKHKAGELEELGQLMHFPWAEVKNG